VAVPEAVLWGRLWPALRFRFAMGLVLVTAMAVAYGIARSTWRPAQALADAVRRIGADVEGVHIPSDGPPELADVARALEETLGSLHLRQRELAALLQASQALTSSLDLDEILRTVIEEAARISGAPAVRLLVLDEASAVLRYRVGVGIPPEEEREVVIPVGESFSGQVAATGQPLNVADCRADSRLRYPTHVNRQSLISYLGLPVTVRERLIGVLVFNTSAPREYSAAEIALLSTFAGQAASALENARLYEELRRAAKDLEARVGERTRELSAANAELARASRHKSEFLANMSHELRTPLNSIIGFSEVLLGQRAGPLTEKQARYLGHVLRSGKHLLQLISDILDLSKVEAGKLTLQPQALPIPTIIEEVLVITRGFAHQKAQGLHSEIAPDLPTLWADPVRVKQILFNLLSNAVKFTPERGRITLRATRVQEARPDAPGGPVEEWLEVAVRDTGVGIAPEDLPRLFQEFVQLEPVATKQHEGTGLGLALTRRLVALHGGRIWAESAGPGCGACFTVRLPLLEPPPPMRVLVVEDQLPVLEALCLTLQTAGYAVERAVSGAEALRQFTESPPDLVILDIGLPDVDGWQILAHVRQQPRTGAVPVLVITGQDQVRADRAVALGANEFLAKPVSPRVLLETTTRLLGVQNGSPVG
jgi:signal transduction histidine kinase